MARNRNSNQLASHGAQAALDQMKYELHKSSVYNLELILLHVQTVL